jgi:hypothetical protein
MTFRQGAVALVLAGLSGCVAPPRRGSGGGR